MAGIARRSGFGLLMVPAASPDAYVASLRGWQRSLVEQLRKAVALNKTLGDPTDL